MLLIPLIVAPIWINAVHSPDIDRVIFGATFRW